MAEQMLRIGQVKPASTNPQNNMAKQFGYYNPIPLLQGQQVPVLNLQPQTTPQIPQTNQQQPQITNSKFSLGESLFRPELKGTMSMIPTNNPMYSMLQNAFMSQTNPSILLPNEKQTLITRNPNERTIIRFP